MFLSRTDTFNMVSYDGIAADTVYCQEGHPTAGSYNNPPSLRGSPLFPGPRSVTMSVSTPKSTEITPMMLQRQIQPTAKRPAVAVPGSLMSALGESLVCPVCLEVARVPFELCRRGHILCHACSRTLPRCPLCRASFVLHNPVCIKNVLEAWPRLCRYSDNGCNLVGLDLGCAGDDHERFCGFRPVFCVECHKPVLARDLKNHHTDSKLARGKFVRAYREEFYYTHRIYVDETYFWLTTVNVKNAGLWISLRACFVGKPTRKAFVRLHFLEDEVGVSVTLQAAGENDAGRQAKDRSHAIVANSQTARCRNHDQLIFGYEIFWKPLDIKAKH